MHRSCTDSNHDPPKRLLIMSHAGSSPLQTEWNVKYIYMYVYYQYINISHTHIYISTMHEHFLQSTFLLQPYHSVTKLSPIFLCSVAGVKMSTGCEARANTMEKCPIRSWQMTEGLLDRGCLGVLAPFWPLKCLKHQT